MSILEVSILEDLNALIPTHYEVVRVAFQQDDGSVMAYWDARILNADGKELAMLHPTSQPDAALLAALVSWYQASKAQFETATGLTEWTE